MGAEDTAGKELEQLLTRHIGPLAKMLLARALKTARDDNDLLQGLAKNIDDDTEREAFITAAQRLLVSRPLVVVAATPASTATAPPPTPTSLAAPAPPPERSPAPPDGGAMKAGAIFISYARDNIAVAQHVTEALRAAGLEVWLDLGQLQPGDAWDLKIRRNIDACSFFVPLVSRETEARKEGYFRREWALAADRAMNFADDVPFIVPVTIDETAAYTARVPERFRRAHWISVPRGEVTPELVDCLKQLVMTYHR